ncbi:MAG: hypothetical protein D6820_05695, partial [Lentisphaerae bacterium]
MAEKLPMLALSPTMEKGVISNWLKKEGDPIEAGETICEVETDKAVMEYQSMASGTLLKILLQEGEEAGIGDPIAIVGEEGEAIDALLATAPASPEAASPSQPKTEGPAEAPVPEPQPEKRDTRQTDSGSPRRVRATPAARGLAAQYGIDLSTIDGSGPRGRVTQQDVQKLIDSG